jgi:hypothetical protein
MVTEGVINGFNSDASLDHWLDDQGGTSGGASGSTENSSKLDIDNNKKVNRAARENVNENDG